MAARVVHVAPDAAAVPPRAHLISTCASARPRAQPHPRLHRHGLRQVLRHHMAQSRGRAEPEVNGRGGACVTPPRPPCSGESLIPENDRIFVVGCIPPSHASPDGRLAGRNSGALMSTAPVDHEQHSAEHRTVIPVELMAKHGDDLLIGADRVLVAPGRHGGASPGQLTGAVFAEPHGLPPAGQPKPTLIFAARFMADASFTIAYQHGGSSSQVAGCRSIVTSRNTREHGRVTFRVTVTRRYARCLDRICTPRPACQAHSAKRPALSRSREWTLEYVHSRQGSRR